MASLIDSLINIMDDENRQYTALLDLSNNKTAAIVNGTIAAASPIGVPTIALVNGIINTIKIINGKEACVTDICKILHLSPSEVKVREIVRLLEKKPKEHDALEQSYLNLKNTVKQLTEVNDNNKQLLKQSMDMIEFEINLARNASMAPQTANYGKGAYEENSGLGGGSFDAKQ